ncbi:hypothetical protein MP638_004443, partial [Amoeboaphelidium occidentale]
MTISVNQVLNQLFHDPKKDLVGAEKLLRRAKVINSKIRMKQVKEFLAQDPINLVFQKPKNAKPTPKIHGKLGPYQADLTFLTRYQRQNHNSSFYSSISKIPEQLEMYDEAELIRKSIAHNNRVTNSVIRRGDFVRLLNKRVVFEKEGQRFTLKVYIVEKVGLSSVHVEGKHQKFNLFEVLKVSPFSQDIDNSFRQKQLDIYRADKRIRERE